MPAVVASRCQPRVGSVSLEWQPQAAVAPSPRGYQDRFHHLRSAAEVGRENG